MEEDKKQINYWGELDYQATYEHLNRLKAEAERPAGLERKLEEPELSGNQRLESFREISRDD